jgi:hypothetical protein
MPIETICQGCARKLRVPDEHAGKKARCPQCGMIYVVPGSAAAASPTNLDKDPVDGAHQTTAAPTHVDEDPAPSAHQSVERWQVRTPDGRVFGPVPKQELDQWCAEGRIPPEASLLRDGDTQWRVATEIYPQLANGRRRVNVQSNPFAERVTATPFRPTQTRHYLPHRGGVILTLAILGWAICPVFAPFAWALGNSDLRSMKVGQMDPTGQSLTQAGMVLGMIATILFGIGIVLVCLGSLS